MLPGSPQGVDTNFYLSPRGSGRALTMTPSRSRVRFPTAKRAKSNLRPEVGVRLSRPLCHRRLKVTVIWMNGEEVEIDGKDEGFVFTKHGIDHRLAPLRSAE